MFHIGHLNLLKNAKKHCDYLIVGINADELVQDYKGKEVIVPCAERMEIIKAIRYVDEVVEVHTLDKEAAWRNTPYDVLFIGSDWKGNDRWVNTERQMAKYGVRVEYLPYTESTNSTMIREKLIEY